MIVRNEAANLPACLASCADLFDELVIVDTGSTDETKAIALQALDKHGNPASVFDFAWCDDFSAARNESLRHATGDWIFWMDADDRLDDENKGRLRSLLAGLGDPCGYEAIGVSRHPGGEVVSSSKLRLFHRSLGMKWRWRVHENLFPLDAIEIKPSGVSIIHVGSLDTKAVAAKSSRNLRILWREVQDRPEEPALRYYIGSELTYQGDYATALASLHACRAMLDAQGYRPVYYWFLLLDLGQCYGATCQWEKLAEIEATQDGGRIATELRRRFPPALRRGAMETISVLV